MVRTPSSLEDHLGYWLRILSNEVSSSFARRLEAYGISVAQWVVLRLLFDRPACTLAELADALDMDKGALSRMVGRLVRLGLMKREVSPTSRRELSLILTKKAASLVPKLAAEADKNERVFFAVLTDAQRTAFLQTVKLLIASSTGAIAKPPLS